MIGYSQGGIMQQVTGIIIIKFVLKQNLQVKAAECAGKTQRTTKPEGRVYPIREYNKKTSIKNQIQRKQISEETWTETIKGDERPYYTGFWERIGDIKSYDSIRRDFLNTGKISKKTLMVIMYDTMRFNLRYDTQEVSKQSRDIQYRITVIDTFSGKKSNQIIENQKIIWDDVRGRLFDKQPTSIKKEDLGMAPLFIYDPENGKYKEVSQRKDMVANMLSLLKMRNNKCQNNILQYSSNGIIKKIVSYIVRKREERWKYK